MLKEKSLLLLVKFAQSRDLKHVPLFPVTGLLPGNILTGNSMNHGGEISYATILASAESTRGIGTMKFLESVAIPCTGRFCYNSRCKRKFSYCRSIVKNRVDPLKVHNQMLAVGKTIGEAM